MCDGSISHFCLSWCCRTSGYDKKLLHPIIHVSTYEIIIIMGDTLVVILSYFMNKNTGYNNMVPHGKAKGKPHIN